MEHLIYVLWHDSVKPWLKNRLLDAAYILACAAIGFAVAVGAIYSTIVLKRLIGG